mmetsp:Transcript_2305/g.7056  ORF Transcript_2305/g.7056 Transcript_2305/m.7056 type:complete len:294 (+) Transcript_2305:196-1077(+)
MSLFLLALLSTNSPSIMFFLTEFFSSSRWYALDASTNALVRSKGNVIAVAIVFAAHPITNDSTTVNFVFPYFIFNASKAVKFIVCETIRGTFCEKPRWNANKPSRLYISFIARRYFFIRFGVLIASSLLFLFSFFFTLEETISHGSIKAVDATPAIAYLFATDIIEDGFRSLLASFVVFTKLTREKYRKSSANNRIIVLPLSLEKRFLPFVFLVFFVSSSSLLSSSSSSSSPPKKDTKHSTIVLARHPALAPSTPSLTAKAEDDDLCVSCLSTSLIAPAGVLWCSQDSSSSSS